MASHPASVYRCATHRWSLLMLLASNSTAATDPESTRAAAGAHGSQSRRDPVHAGANRTPRTHRTPPSKRTGGTTRAIRPPGEPPAVSRRATPPAPPRPPEATPRRPRHPWFPGQGCPRVLPGFIRPPREIGPGREHPRTATRCQGVGSNLSGVDSTDLTAPTGRSKITPERLNFDGGNNHGTCGRNRPRYDELVCRGP